MRTKRCGGFRTGRRVFFRQLHPHICIATASDRYKGWLGQIYTEGLYKDRISSRTKRVGKSGFREEVLPVDSVREYFEHFKALEIDYTFYAPLIERDAPTACYETLKKYSSHLGPEDRVFLKAPRMFFAPKLRVPKGYIANANYLACEPFIRQFHKPATDLLGSQLKGIIFEQEYQRLSERIPASEFAARLDVFLAGIPCDLARHVELRTESYSCKPVREVLEKHGAGQILSHWTWLPGLKTQFARAGQRFVTSGGEAVVRLMTPLNVRYEQAYARAFPFDRIVEEMLQPEMVKQTAMLMHEALKKNVRINVIINNRAGGNAPLLAQKIIGEFIEQKKRYAGI
ncbi:MAG: DUF72 domain-containing protein [Syntrophobacteraceae bacterium]